MTLQDLREALCGKLDVRVEAGSIGRSRHEWNYEANGPRMARIPITLDSRTAKKGRPKGQLPMLPDLNADLEPPKRHMTWLRDAMKDVWNVWNSQTLQNQFYGSWMEQKHRDPERQAWDEAVAWIAAKHAPPEPEKPISFEWSWPARGYVRPHYEEDA